MLALAFSTLGHSEHCSLMRTRKGRCQSLSTPAWLTRPCEGRTEHWLTRAYSYASTKSGQLGLMHSMAISLQPQGIRVNLIAPGRVKAAHESKEGDESGTSWADQNEEKDVLDHPTNRAGRPKDIADAAEYLVNAGFLTGQDLTIDGGATKMKK